MKGAYRQVERPRLLEFTWLPSWQEEALETVVRFDLTENNGATNVRLTHSGLTTEKARGSHKGWPQILEWLRSYCEKQGKNFRFLSSTGGNSVQELS